MKLPIITEWYLFPCKMAAILNFELGAPQDIFQKNFFIFFSIYIDILQLSYPQAFENIDFDFFAACFTPP